MVGITCKLGSSREVTLTVEYPVACNRREDPCQVRVILGGKLVATLSRKNVPDSPPPRILHISHPTRNQMNVAVLNSLTSALTTVDSYVESADR